MDASTVHFYCHGVGGHIGGVSAAALSGVGRITGQTQIHWKLSVKSLAKLKNCQDMHERILHSMLTYPLLLISVNVVFNLYLQLSIPLDVSSFSPASSPNLIRAMPHLLKFGTLMITVWVTLQLKEQLISISTEEQYSQESMEHLVLSTQQFRLPLSSLEVSSNS